MSLGLIFARMNQFPYRDTSKPYMIPRDKIQHLTHRFPLHVGSRIGTLFFRYELLLRGGFHWYFHHTKWWETSFALLPVAHLPL
jgi:hypothetical protein